MADERKTKGGWLAGAIVAWLAGFACIVIASVDVIGGSTAVFSLGFAIPITAHASLAVLALWLFRKARPAMPESAAAPAPAAGEPAQQGGA